jgi:hypothetical protein
MVQMLRRTVMFVAALLTLGVGVALAAIPNTSDFLHRTTPMISGTVFSVDDRQIVVDTDQGQRVTLVMDSRTMLPVDLAPGMVMRAEFRVMENGQYYVNRITPIRGSVNARRAEASARDRGLASDLAQANTAPTYANPTPNPQAAPAEQPVATAPAAAVPAPSRDRPVTLPQTAGHRALIALFGLVALSGAGALMLSRHLRRA